MKEETYDKMKEITASSGGAVVGALIGGLFAGPVGAAGSALVGTIVENVMNKVGEEVKDRYLSKKESERIGKVLTGSVNISNDRLLNGGQIRSDDFFEIKEDNRSYAEEILEGSLLVAQREYEERKLQYIARLHSATNFDERITGPIANQLIKLVENISYRQIVIISVLGRSTSNLNDFQLRDIPFNGFENINDKSIAAEIFELYRWSIIISKEAIIDSARFTPSLLVLDGLGELLFNCMGLYNKIGGSTEKEIIDFLTNMNTNSDENVVVGKVSADNMSNLQGDKFITSKEATDIAQNSLKNAFKLNGGTLNINI